MSLPAGKWAELVDEARHRGLLLQHPPTLESVAGAILDMPVKWESWWQEGNASPIDVFGAIEFVLNTDTENMKPSEAALVAFVEFHRWKAKQKQKEKTFTFQPEFIHNIHDALEKIRSLERCAAGSIVNDLHQVDLLRRVRELEEELERSDKAIRQLNLDVEALREANVENHRLMNKQDAELFELRKKLAEKKKKAKPRRTNG